MTACGAGSKKRVLLYTRACTYTLINSRDDASVIVVVRYLNCIKRGRADALLAPVVGLINVGRKTYAKNGPERADNCVSRDVFYVLVNASVRSRKN